VSSGADLDAHINLLRGVWLFSGCTDAELARIAMLVQERAAAAGDALTREGESATEFFVVVDGNAVATVDGDEVGRLGPGAFFGEMALLDGGERLATVIAASAMKLLVLDRDDFNEMLEVAMPSVAPKLLAVVGARMRTLEEHAGVRSTLGL
jgi:CRP-like cAMP-binding protein